MNIITANIDYLKGIAENDFAVLQQIYAESLPEVVKYVRRNSGNLEDAQDIFQEGILAIYKKVRTDDLELTTSFHNFLFMVCKRLWLKKLRKKTPQQVTFEEALVFEIEQEAEAQFIKTQKWTLFNEKFQLLSEECRRVLKMLFNGKSGKEIADAMDYSEEYAKRKKYKCKKGLAKLIKTDAAYQQLSSGLLTTN